MSFANFLIILVLLCLNAHTYKAVRINITIPYNDKILLPGGYAALGEGPHWDIETQSLYYVDLEVGRLLRYDYRQNKVYSCKIPGVEMASFIIPVDGHNNKFVIGDRRRALVVAWDGISKTGKLDRVLFEVEAGDKYVGNRFNDAKVDPRGRLFCGTMKYVGDIYSDRLGQLYKYQGGKLILVKTDVGISNGLTWDEKRNKFYYIDTADFDVKAYDYNFDTGVPSKPKVIFDLHKPKPIEPDGMTIDTDGNIYVATYTGYTVYKINPTTRKVLMALKFACKQITSVAFGGPNLDILFVTSSAKFGEPAPCGNTFKITGLGAKGLPMNKVKL